MLLANRSRSIVAALTVASVAALGLDAAAQTPPPFPTRTHRPDLHDPGIDGGGRLWFSRGEVTPDGRLMVAYRRVIDPAYGGTAPSFGDAPWQSALTVSVIDPDAFNVDPDGHLAGYADGNAQSFYDELTSYTPYGTDFVYGDAGTGGFGTGDWAFVHWGVALEPWVAGVDPLWQKIDACASPAFLSQDMKFDLTYPVSTSAGGNSMITVANRETGHGNPFPSDANGNFDADGTHTTYALWLVRRHCENYYDEVNQQVWYECNPDSNPGTYANPLLRLKAGAPQYPVGVMACQDLTVVLDANDQIVMTDITPFQKLTTDSGGLITSLEPSITADGKLIIFNSSGSDPSGLGRVTYVYNETGSSATGWSEPKSITELPALSEIEPALSANGYAGFKDRYRLFANPIVLPATATQPEYVHSVGEGVRGPYTWIGKDGSFWVAMSTYSYESAVDPDSKRAGAYVCGDLTGGYIKYVDDNGVNPTRAGAPWHWPPYLSTGKTRDSTRSVSISAGMRPGPWDAVAAEGLPMPDQVADRYIPVLPIIFTISKIYGEIRFEEVDGHYLLYMPCNESLTLDPDVASGAALMGTEPHILDPTSTQDTSGRAPRASAALNAGAGFARDVFEASLGATGPALLRQLVGQAYGLDTLHENVGFRGQGILFSDEGVVEVDSPRGFLGEEEFSAQTFVKVVGAPAGGPDMTLIEHGGAFPVFQLTLTGLGEFRADVFVTDGVTPQVATLTSRQGAIGQLQPVHDQDVGWRHVAVTYDGDDDGRSVLRLWVEGQIEDEIIANGVTSVYPAPGAPYTLVGPGRDALGVPPADPTPIDLTNTLLILDEVALSDVPRTERELRRDACVEPAPSAFEGWPAGQPLPVGLEADEANWPVGVAYNQKIVDLGELLFEDTLLSPGNDRSCTTCHVEARDFTDGQTLPTALSGGPLPPFNTPTLINAVFGTHKTFSGQAASLEAQAVIPLTHPEEMGVQTMADVVARVAADTTIQPNGKTYAQTFLDEFGVAVNEDDLTEALAAYQRTLLRGGSPFDQWLQIASGLTDAQARGMATFFGKARCGSCHSGSNFSDDDFHNIRSVAAGTLLTDRGDVTGRDIDEGALKTPTLRNLRRTGPYFHDGSKANLFQVIDHYDDPFTSEPNPLGVTDTHLRPLDLTPGERDDLVRFLQALNG